MILATCTPLIMTGPPAAPGIGGWLIANAALGVGLAIGGGGRRTWGPAFLGLLMAGTIAGVVAAAAVLLGILPQAADTDGSTSPPVLVGLLVAIFVLVFGAPIEMIGAVIGSVVVDARTERRHRAIARGEVPLRQPSGKLESRSQATKPLDDLGVAKATSDGAATTVIREYPLDPDPDALIAADTQRLGAIGYAIDSVIRHPGRTGLGYRLIGAVLFLLDLALFFSAVPSLSAAFREATRGRVVVTFKLVSRTHGPVAADPSRVRGG